MIKYSRTIYTFKKINPSKKYYSFTFYPIEDIKTIGGYMFKDAIIKFRDNFYLFSGSKEQLTADKMPSLIEVKNGKTVFISIYA